MPDELEPPSDTQEIRLEEFSAGVRQEEKGKNYYALLPLMLYSRETEARRRKESDLLKAVRKIFGKVGSCQELI